MKKSPLDLRLAIPAVFAWSTAGVLIGVPGAHEVVAWVLWALTTLLAVMVPLRALAVRRRQSPVASGCVAGSAVTGRTLTSDRVADTPGTGDTAPVTRGVGGSSIDSTVIDRTLVAMALTAITVASMALVATSIAVKHDSRYPAEAFVAASGGRTASATILVSADPKRARSGDGYDDRRDRYSFRGSITRLVVGEQIFRVEAPVRVFVTMHGERIAPDDAGLAGGGDAPDPPDNRFAASGIRIGATLEVAGTVRSFGPQDQVVALMFARGSPTVAAAAPAWLDWAGQLRTGFSRAARTLPGDGGSLLPGLAIGDTRAVSDALDQAMKDSSLSHLTAVSGANCAVVVAGVMLVGAGLGLRRGIRITAALVTLAGFVILVTPEGSVLRASVMAVVVLLSLATGRMSHGVPALSLACLILLVIDPWLARDFGFALSVLATGGLLLLAGPIHAVLSRWLPAWIAMLIAIPLAAQLACQPVLVLLDPSLSLFGVPANLLAAPAAPVATVLGLIGCLLLPIAPAAGQFVVSLAWFPSWWIAAVAQATSAWPAARLPWLGGALGLVLVGALTACGLVVLLRRRSGSVAWALSLVIMLVTGAIYTGVYAGTRFSHRMAVPGDWQVAACDIGQGDAVVLRFGDLHALVDTGPDPLLLAACLERLGVESIDLLVLTHFDLDHIGGASAVVGRSRALLVGPPETAADRRLLHSFTAAGTRVLNAVSGMSGSLADSRWQVLWPRAGDQQFAVGNPGSVTIRFDSPAMSSIFLGDLGEDAQRALLASHRLAPVDVVKVAHHGSADQSGELYRRLGARVGLISVGAGNSYGHPTRRILQLLAESRTSVQRTDEQGMIVVSPPGGDDRIRVWSERIAAGTDGNR